MAIVEDAMRKQSYVALYFALIAAACGGSNGSTSPTAPSPSPTGVNRPPEIASASVTPSEGGWRDLTSYTAHIDARDPDGERLTYAWTNFRGEPVQGVFSNGGADVSFTVQSVPGDFPKNLGPLTVTVNDPRGASASSRIQFEARHFGNARFLGRIGNVEYVWLYLNQTGGALSGTLIGADRDGFDRTSSDSGRPGSVDAQSNFTITFDLRRGQLTLVGQVSRGLYGYQLTGTAHGAGFFGDRFDFGESTYAEPAAR